MTAEPRQTPGGPCAACGSGFTRALSWSGRGTEKYCSSRPCQRKGEQAGHIIRFSRAAGGPARADGVDGREFLTDMELLKLGEIISTRIFNLGQLRSEVGFSNKVPADDRRLHLLIYGKGAPERGGRERALGPLVDDRRAAAGAGEGVHRRGQGRAQGLPRTRGRAVGRGRVECL